MGGGNDTKKLSDSGKRKPPAAGKGRPKGAVNKTTKAVKDMILAALDRSGGEDYLMKQATDNPTAFLTLVGKVLPLDVNNNHSGGVRVIHVPFPKSPLDER